MPYTSRSVIRLKLFVILAAVGIAVLGFVGLVPEFSYSDASASGPTPSHTNAPGEANCTECHSSFPVNSGTGSVTFTGLPSSYAPVQQIQLTVRTAQSDA